MSNVSQLFRIVGGYGTATAGTTQTQAGATKLTCGINYVTTGNANDGVALPTGYALGDAVIIVNSSANSLNVYPYVSSGGAINAGSANAAKALAANMSGLYVSLDNDNWAAVLSA